MNLLPQRLVICGLLALLGAMHSGITAQSGTTLATLHIHATAVEELRAWDSYLTQHERAGDLRLRVSRSDPDLPSRMIERLDQFHQGVPIWGADIIRDSERGVPISIFGVLAPDLTLSVQPSLTVSAAAAVMTQAAGVEATLLRMPELVVLPIDSAEHRLAYMAVVARAMEVNRLFVDAHTGAELLRYSEIQTQSAVGTGRGVLGDTKKLSVSQQTGTFVASDSHRPPVISTWDMKGNFPRATSVLSGVVQLTPADLASDTDNVWTDAGVVDAHAHVGLTYDYYYKRFGRSGLDGRDKPIAIMVNAVTQQGSLSAPPAARSFILNAGWCPPCYGGNGFMIFGSGIPAGTNAGNGRNYNAFAGALDIAAHELTHAVTSSTSDLTYVNESGALNEAFSDMMGKSVEFYYHPPGSNPGQADYVIGKDISRAVVAGALNGDRSMANPSLYGDPDHYQNRYVGPNDNGGVHHNSGIANHAFFLAIEGGTNRTSGLTVRGVGAANREQIEKVFYRAFTLLMPKNATFVTARIVTTQAARDLYGSGGTVEQAIDSAWTAVGVPDPGSIATLTGSVAAGAAVSFVVSMAVNGTYSANLRGNDSGVDLDFVLAPNTTACSRWPLPSSCRLAVSDSPEAVESLKWPVRSGERYLLWIANLGPRGSSFSVEHFTSATSSSSATGGR